MSRLLGIITRQPVDILLTIGQPQHVMLSTHGWGAAWYEKKKLKIQKGVRSVLNPEFNQPVRLSIQTNIFILHLRQATSGTISKENTHPFQYNNFAFAHMGSINKERLLNSLTAPFNSKFESEPIDSEIYFRALMQNEKDSSMPDAIKKVTSQVNNKHGANFIISDGESLYSYRYGLDLYWQRWNQKSEFSITTQFGFSVTSTALSSNPAYVIASDKIMDGNWTAFDDGELFVVEKNLQYESFKMD